MLEGLLEWHRATLLHKCAGLTGEQLALRAAPPSTLSLLGLVRHMADVERSWFRRRLRGEEIPPIHQRPDVADADFEDTNPARADRDLEILRREWEDVRAAAAEVSLDHTFRHPHREEWMSLRWVYLHMIEEYARHNGHADILRERIDGAKGE
ncbi:DinB family protein [Spiractinospora alimapuensis]|nr:DinB family protein [Spiractinospora alimapuensis]